MKYRTGAYNYHHCKDLSLSIIALIVLVMLIQGCLLYSKFNPTIATVTEPTTYSAEP